MTCANRIFRIARGPAMLLLGLYAAMAVVPGIAEAQTYPNRPVRIVVPAAAGGALDVMARLLATKVGEIWKHQFYVENKPGANWIIGMDAVAKSAPDGYTLLFVASSGLTINPFVFPNMPLDPLRDLAPVTIAAQTPFVLLLNPAVPARTVPELVAHLRANPGKLNHGSNSATTILVSELFKQQAGVEYLDVNYRGASQAIVATLAGTTEFCFVDLGSATSAIEGKTLHPVGLTTLDTLQAQSRHPDLRRARALRRCRLGPHPSARACQRAGRDHEQAQCRIPAGAGGAGRGCEAARHGPGGDGRKLRAGGASIAPGSAAMAEADQGAQHPVRTVSI